MRLTTPRLPFPLIPFPLARFLARALLRSMGYGTGSDVSGSGEIRAMTQALALAGAGRNITVFDVGAHTGAWSKAVLAAFPGAAIYAFEPSAAHVARYQTEVGQRPNVHLFPWALGAEEKSATLYKDAEVTGHASLTRRDLRHAGLEMALSETVEVRTVDAVVQAERIDRIHYLKIDVEGHELQVLEGARSAFQRGTIDAVQFEFGGCNIDTRTFFRDFHHFFSDHRYRIWIIRPGGHLARISRYKEFHEQFTTTNFIATRPL